MDFANAELLQQRGYAPKGQRLIVRKDLTEHVTYNLSIATSLAGNGALGISEYRRVNHKATDFLQFVLQMIATGFLVHGDYLICDNATTHRAAEIVDRLDAALTAAGVRLVFMPSYSPELNPCELVFSKVKSHLRYRRGNGSFADELSAAFKTITDRDLVRFYIKCIHTVLQS
jgi:transposase